MLTQKAFADNAAVELQCHVSITVV